MKLIILAAGDSFELDGFNKLLIKHPKYKKTILEVYKDFFDVKKIDIVVGYRSIEIMSAYPKINYIFNKKWQTTGSAFSLSLALTDEPCYVISSDFLIDLDRAKNILHNDNFAVIKKSESRRITSLNARIEDKTNRIIDVYKGKSTNKDAEVLGIFKVTDQNILRLWKKNGIINSTSYAGETIPYKTNKISAVPVDDDTITEINTTDDYINFLKRFVNHE